MRKRLKAWTNERSWGPVASNVKPDFTHIYTETEFHACLLVHGWRNNIANPNAYWYSIDLWFKDAWPERHVEKQEMNDHTGQMEFKLQFFTWVRSLHHEYPERVVTNFPSAKYGIPDKLTQLCKSGRKQ